MQILDTVSKHRANDKRLRAHWLAPCLLGAFFASVLVLGYVLHVHASRAAEQTAHETLRLSTLMSAHSINTWLGERLADAEAIGSSAVLTQSLGRRVRGSVEQSEQAGTLRDYLERMQTLYGYRTLAIVDVASKRVIVISGVPLDMDQSYYLAGSNLHPRAEWIELSATDANEPRLGLVRGILGDAMSTPYVLYMELDPRWLVDSLSKAKPTNWKGEALLLRSNGLQFLSPSTGPQLQTLAQTYTDARRTSARTLEARLTAPSASIVQGRNRSGVAGMASRESLLLPGWLVVCQLPDQAVYSAVREGDKYLILGGAFLLVTGALCYLTWRRGDRLRNAAREAGLRGHYEQLLRGSTAIFLLTDDEGTILDASQAAAIAHGYPREKLLGMAAQRLRPTAYDKEQAEMWANMKPGDSQEVRLARLRADGSTFLLEGNIGCFEANGAHYFVSIGHDVTRQALVETQLRVATSFFERSAAAIVIADKDRRIVAINQQLTKITGYELTDLKGQPTALMNAGLEPGVLERARVILLEEDFWEGEMHLQRKDGTTFPARLLVCAHRRADGQIEQYVDFFTDLTRLREAERRAEYLSIHDPLTQLPNRAKLEQDLSRHLGSLDGVEGAAQRSVSLALINLDRFTAVNESFGYSQGDALLLKVAERLRGLSHDLIGLYRHSGDEFMLLLEGNPMTHALLITKVRALLSQPVRLGEHPVSPTASIGVASYPEHATTAEHLLLNVESAMRMAKAQGRNTWRLYAPEMNASAYNDMLLAVDLRQAIDAGQLKLFFQPQFCLADGKAVGVEALLRWTHESRGPVSPAHFIPIAESSGMIGEISSWVLRSAARTWAQWRTDGLDPLPIAINVSSTQFTAPDFLYEVRRVVSEFDLPRGALEMELTESILMANTDAAVELMHQLVAMGIHLAIDDFGTGYSSLSYLRRFPVSKLKIDRSFILDLGKSGQSEAEAIASAVIAMGKSLKLRVIAEGVETESQRDFLRLQGCDEVQGYLYARPMPLEQLKSSLRVLEPGTESVAQLKS